MTTVGVCLESNLQAVEIILGCMQAGISMCILSMRWPAASIDWALERLGIEHVITTRTDLKAKKIAPQSCYNSKVVHPGINSHLCKTVSTIMYTTGSSAEPKAVVHTLNNHITSAESAISKLNLREKDRWLLNLPLWHVSGMSIVFRCLIAGAEIIPPASETSLYEQLFTHGITHVSMVSTQLMQVMDASAPKSLRAAIVGGGPVPHNILDKAIKNGWPIRTTYGMTETSSMVTLSEENFLPGYSGNVLRGHELKISTDGEILVRSPAVCSGYLDRGELQSIVDKEGWFHTGDLGELHPIEGLYVLGRKDNMYISGGENISPEEIESVLCKFSGVEETIVVPVPDSKFGQRSVAFIRGKVDFEDIAPFLIQNLPKFKIPTCYPWPENIRSESMKPDRKSLMNLAIQLQKV